MSAGLLSYETYRRSLTPVVRAVYRLEVRGLEHVPPTGSLVVAGNHDSILDPFIVAAAIPRPIRYLGEVRALERTRCCAGGSRSVGGDPGRAGEE